MPYRLLILIVSVIVLAITSRANAVNNMSSFTFIEPESAGVVLPEIDEFATMVLGDPWDMEQPTDLAFYRSDSAMINSLFADGVYSAQMTSGDGRERITLLTAGAINNTAMRIGKIGYNYPINADHYRYLTYRIYKGHNNFNSGLIQWFADDSYSSSAMGISNSFLIPAEAGWHTIVVDLKTIGIQAGSKNWEGTIRELIIKPFAGTGAAGATVKLDWARLTAEDPRTTRPFTIRWNGGSGPINLYLSAGDTVLDDRDILIAAGLDSGVGELAIHTGGLPAGEYFVGAESGGTVVWSDGPLIINSVPFVTIEKPSKTSGEDYAATVLDKAWDMTSNRDINYNLPPWQQEAKCVTNESFINGIYTAHIIPDCPPNAWPNDPILFLGHMPTTVGNIVQPIDTHKYRYLSYRFFHSGIQDVHNGWIVRWGWWQIDPATGAVTQLPVMGRDLIILEGWNTYKADLWAHDVVDENHPIQRSWRDSAPNQLRFDPTEVWLPGYHVQLDWIKLTAMDEVRVGQPFPIKYNVTKLGVEMTFYYDTDTNPNNGRTLIGSTIVGNSSQTDVVLQANVANTAYQLYLPLIQNNYIHCDNSDCFIWDTTGVTPGEYYVCIDVDDGINSFYQCSEAPLLVRP